MASTTVSGCCRNCQVIWRWNPSAPGALLLRDAFCSTCGLTLYRLTKANAEAFVSKDGAPIAEAPAEALRALRRGPREAGS
jgi:hypothetical protein